jgi:iron complex transport system ATP-binding protein
MIEVIDITLKRGKRNILEKFSYNFPTIGGTLVIGKNGAGKSSLVRAIAGDLPISDGEIRINEKDIAKLKPVAQFQLRSVAGQRSEFQFGYKVGEILELPFIYGKECGNRKEIEKLLDINRDLRVNELSIGQQQRVNIAMALIVDTPYYLLDEPFSAQDSNHQAAIEELLLEIARDHGVVVVSHGVSRLNSGFSNICSVE